MPADIDVYADENEPSHSPFYTILRIAPNPKGDLRYYAYLRIYTDGLCELDCWYWFGIKSLGRPYDLRNEEDRIVLGAQQEVWEWLNEWEYVQLRRIGPEDSEYFVGEKLLDYADHS